VAAVFELHFRPILEAYRKKILGGRTKREHAKKTVKKVKLAFKYQMWSKMVVTWWWSIKKKLAGKYEIFNTKKKQQNEIEMF